MPGARAGAHQREVAGDLRQRDGEHLQRAGELDERVAVGLRLERVERRGDLFQAGLACCSRARTFSANFGWVFRPVPVAVPPSGICPTWTSADGDPLLGERDLRGVAARTPARA